MAAEIDKEAASSPSLRSSSKKLSRSRSKGRDREKERERDREKERERERDKVELERAFEAALDAEQQEELLQRDFLRSSSKTPGTRRLASRMPSCIHAVLTTSYSRDGAAPRAASAADL